MSELNINLIKTAFKTYSITQKDYLRNDQLYQIISKLNLYPFDQDTYQEIWDQCKLNSKGEVRISDFIDYLIKAEELLIQKQIQNTNDIAKLQGNIKGKISDFSQQKKYKDGMDSLTTQKEAIKNSLAIIRKPFIVIPQTLAKSRIPSLNQNNEIENEPQVSQEDIVRQLFEYDSAETPSVLSNILYITQILIALTALSSFFITQFLSLIIYTIILSQFSLQIISRKLIKFNLILLLVSTIYDILWLAIQTSKIWYLPTNYQFADMLSNYLKFSLIIIITCTCLRGILIYYYLSQFHIEQYQTYTIKIFGKQLNITRQTQPYNSRQNPYSYLLQPYFNKKITENDQ